MDSDFEGGADLEDFFELFEWKMNYIIKNIFQLCHAR